MTWQACVGIKRFFAGVFFMIPGHHLLSPTLLSSSSCHVVIDTRSFRASTSRSVVQSFSRRVLFMSISRRSYQTFVCVYGSLLSSPSIITYHNLPLARTTTLLQCVNFFSHRVNASWRERIKRATSRRLVGEND